jgi:hypothetical protein
MPITDEQFKAVFNLVDLAFHEGAKSIFGDKYKLIELNDKYSKKGIETEIRKIFGGEA